jgi:hypothetical protein
MKARHNEFMDALVRWFACLWLLLGPFPSRLCHIRFSSLFFRRHCGANKTTFEPGINVTKME